MRKEKNAQMHLYKSIGTNDVIRFSPNHFEFAKYISYHALGQFVILQPTNFHIYRFSNTLMKHVSIVSALLSFRNNYLVHLAVNNS